MLKPERDDLDTLTAPQVVLIPVGYIFATWPATNTAATECVHQALLETKEQQ